MFGFLKDNKPEILKQINNAIIEENKRLTFAAESLIEKLSTDDNMSEMELSQYIFNIRLDSPFDNTYEKKIITVENASSREMFQALNKISPDAEYDVENDSARGTVKGYHIFLMRHKGFGRKYVGILATYNKIDVRFQDLVNEYKINKNSKEIPSFINDLME